MLNSSSMFLGKVYMHSAHSLALNPITCHGSMWLLTSSMLRSGKRSNGEHVSLGGCDWVSRTGHASLRYMVLSKKFRRKLHCSRTPPHHRAADGGGRPVQFVRQGGPRAARSGR